MRVGFAYQGLLDRLRAVTFSPKKYTLMVIHGFESNSDLFLGKKKDEIKQQQQQINQGINSWQAA